MALRAPSPFSGGDGHVVGIAAHPEADDLGIDFRAARLRRFVLFEQHRTAAVAHDEAVAILVPRAARPLRIVIALRQRLGLSEAADAGFAGRHLRAARQHGIHFAVLNETHGKPSA